MGQQIIRNTYLYYCLFDDLKNRINTLSYAASIQTAVANRYIRYEKPLVIIPKLQEITESNRGKSTKISDSIALIQQLSPKEQRAFELKLKEIKDQHKNFQDFYSFMISTKPTLIKSTSKMWSEYPERTKIFPPRKQSFPFWPFLTHMCQIPPFHYPQCEKFLGITNKKAFWGTEKFEDKMGTYSTILIKETEVVECGNFTADALFTLWCH